MLSSPFPRTASLCSHVVPMLIHIHFVEAEKFSRITQVPIAGTSNDIKLQHKTKLQQHQLKTQIPSFVLQLQQLNLLQHHRLSKFISKWNMMKNVKLHKTRTSMNWYHSSKKLLTKRFHLRKFWKSTSKS